MLHAAWLFASILLTIGAVIASVFALLTARRAFATAAHCSGSIREWEKTERLTPSKLAELAEFNDAVKRSEELLAKVNRREIARAKQRDAEGQFATSSGSKDDLRRIAGLRAGQPARHQ